MRDRICCSGPKSQEQIQLKRGTMSHGTEKVYHTLVLPCNISRLLLQSGLVECPPLDQLNA